MKRDALVVGINHYPFLKDTPTSKAKHLKTPAGDAEAIAQLLETYGGFRVRRLPASIIDDRLQVDPTKIVELRDLEEAIANLFNPQGTSISNTALLFFTGHGLRKSRGGITEGYLGTSDTNPSRGVWGLSLQWLRRLLQESPVRQQIVWLDCCHSGELLNFQETLATADPGNQENLTRCFITASREFEVAYEETSGNHGVLTGALLRGLDPTQQPDGWVTIHSLAGWIERELSRKTQHPLCKNSDRTIVLTVFEPYLREMQIESAQRTIEAGGIRINARVYRDTRTIKALEYLTKGCSVEMRQRISNYLVTFLFGNCIDLGGADLNEANLEGINLERANLREANLQGAKLQKANLQGADFDRANLQGANFDTANLQGADLYLANLQGAFLSGANLSWVNLGDAILLRANLNGANLDRANLWGVMLIGADLVGANLQETDLSLAKLQGAKLFQANLRGANLRGANLRGSHFTGADLTGADLTRADLREAYLTVVRGLTPTQVKSAQNWETAIYDKEFRAELGLSPQPAKVGNEAGK